jgi:hypothetical protein
MCPTTGVETIRLTEAPAQKEVGPEAITIGTIGRGFTFTV